MQQKGSETTLTILCTDRPQKADEALSKLALFSGVDAEIVDARAFLSRPPLTSRVALTGRTLAALGALSLLEDLKSRVEKTVSHLLIAGSFPQEEGDTALRQFTDSRITAVLGARGRMRPYVISRRAGAVTGPLTGLTLGPVAQGETVFARGSEEPFVEEIIRIGGLGHFVRFRTGMCDAYLLGCTEPVDLDAKLSDPPVLRRHFSSLFPILMFLRQAFGPCCWHSPHNQACLTIDDPLLVTRYGSVDYQDLLSFMDRYNFFTTIAFIPWNYRRTSSPVARLLVKRKDRISVCVHGCDHTRHELADADHGELNGRIKLATVRMLEHQRLTGIPFDQVMVFPQGAFSSSCMEVLKVNNYLAAVNLERTPVHPFQAMPLRSFLEPAITGFGDFPLFERYYPEETPDLALALFLHKPALILEHHDFFRKRGLEAVRSIKRINRLDPALRWGSLEGIFARSSLQKMEEDGTVSVRTWCRKTLIENPSTLPARYVFLKDEKDPGYIEKVLVNGRERECALTDSGLSLTLDVEGGDRTLVDIVYRDPYPYTPAEESLFQHLKVFSRRHLSEIRDNYVSRSRAALALANRMKRLIPS